MAAANQRCGRNVHRAGRDHERPRTHRNTAQVAATDRVGAARSRKPLGGDTPRTDATHRIHERRRENVMNTALHQTLHDEGGVPIKAWIHGVPVDDGARKQLRNRARLPIVGPWIAVMPDVHLGIGATVGLSLRHI